MYPVHKRSGLARAARWMVGSALLVGCAGEDGLSLLVNLTDLPPRSDAVKVSSSLDARPGVLEDGDTKKLQGQPRIAITVPAVAQGTLRINVQTLDTDRCIQGISTVTTQVPFPRGTELSATVSAQSPRSCAPLAACAANQLCPPSQSTSTIRLWQVWAISHQDVWAVGDTVLHFNGTTWNQVSNGLPATTVSLKGVWASGPGDVWTVGSDTTTNRGYIFHLSGDRWQETNTQQSKAFFSGIHGTAPNDVWAVSNQSTVTGNSEFRHWNPGLAQWDSITLPSGTPNLYSVWAASSSQVYMVGASGTFLSYDGSKVTSISLSQVMGTSLQHVSGYVDGGRPVVYAVGDAGTIVKIGRLGDTTVLQDKNSMPPPGLLSVGVFPDSAYATADNGSIYTVDSTLTALKLFASSGTTSSPLRGLSAATNGIVWVVGDKDTKRYFDLRP